MTRGAPDEVDKSTKETERRTHESRKISILIF